MANRLLVIISSLLTLAFISACEPVGQTLEKTEEAAGRIPAQESWNTTVRINSVGKETVKAKANYSASFEDPQEILFIGDVQLDFFNQEGVHSSTMSADSGKIDEKQQLFTAQGNVHVVSDSGMTLATSVLYWDEQKELIFTDKRVIFTSETDTLYGIGFESEANLANWTITQPTGVTYREVSDE